MKKITLLLFLLSAVAQGQQSSTTDKKSITQEAADDTTSVDSIEFKPEFPGGIQALYHYIGTNFKRRSKDKGKILLSFVVDQTGKVVEIKVLEGINQKLDKEAVRVMEKSPLWKPAMQNGKLVRCSYQIPIKLN